MKNRRLGGLICIMTLFFADSQASNYEVSLNARGVEILPPIAKIDTNNDLVQSNLSSPKHIIVDSNKENNFAALGKYESPSSIMDCGQVRIQVSKSEVNELDVISQEEAESVEGLEDKSRKVDAVNKNDSTANSPSKMRQGKRWLGVHDKISLTNRGKSRSASKKHKHYFGDQDDDGPDPYKGKFDRRSEYNKLAEMEKKELEAIDSLTSSLSSNPDED